VITSAPEVEFVDVPVALCELVEHPAHAHAATMTRASLEMRMGWDGIRKALVVKSL
jgi:hypothetical protein